ncbi:hypothetical protein EON82_20445 [bacterium]|nr:MAG: hypothetical protein EON82_20445 [bacterium]
MRLAVGVVAALLGVSSPALAFSDYCVTDAFPAFILKCDAGPVPANSSGHFIRYSVTPFMKYWLKDPATNVVLRYGNAGATGKRETVFGLYGAYVLEMKGAAGYAYISNT